MIETADVNMCRDMGQKPHVWSLYPLISDIYTKYTCVRRQQCCYLKGVTMQ